MAQLPGIGTIAPPFMLPSITGAELRFGEASRASAQLVLFVKHDCPTCALAAPIVDQLWQRLGEQGLRAVMVSQSPTAETAGFVAKLQLSVPTVLDQQLDVSSRYAFDAVPMCLLAASDGHVLHRTEGWVRDEMAALITTALTRCDAKAPELLDAVAQLPAVRPGCGSRVHDPEVAETRRVRERRRQLTARRIPPPSGQDTFEWLSAIGVTDGLPVVPPTEARVLRMLDGTTRAPDEVVAKVPPNLASVTVEKVAINAVMAGCRPEYLPVVLAAVEAACTDAFNLHGILATTYFSSPVIVVNGPIRRRIGVNCGRNAFGHGSRANATIGRALQLVVWNIGGGKPGEVNMATLGQPGSFTCCLGEHEEASCWEPLHVERGFAPEQSTVTLFAGEAPRAIRDQRSRGARSLATSFGLAVESVAHPKLHRIGEALLVVAPEHVETFARDGFTKADVRAAIQSATARPLAELLPDGACEKGMAPTSLPADWLGSDGQPTAAALATPVPKFTNPDDILIVVAGGRAGKFSAVLGGWGVGPAGSVAVTKEITESCQ